MHYIIHDEQKGPESALLTAQRCSLQPVPGIRALPRLQCCPGMGEIAQRVAVCRPQ